MAGQTSGERGSSSLVLSERLVVYWQPQGKATEIFCRFVSRRIPIQDYLQARYYRLDAELQLLKAKPAKTGNAK